MNLVKTLADLRRKVAGATATVESEFVNLRGQIEAKRRELTKAENSPLPPGEVVGAFSRWVDETAALQSREEGYGLIQGFGVPPGGTTRRPFSHLTEMTWGFACLFLGDMLKESFARLVRATDYQAGPAAEDRGATVALLTEELRLLEDSEEQLVDDMRAQGLTVAHRPEVAQRRETERRQREREEQAVVARRQREEEIDRRHEEARGRAARSPYLERGNAERPGPV